MSDEGDGRETPVYLSGSADAQQKAKQLIEELTRDEDLSIFSCRPAINNMTYDKSVIWLQIKTV